MNNTNTTNDPIFKDYVEKIKPKIKSDDLITAEDFNNLVVLLNWCFVAKNDFFIKDFNKKVIKSICTTYTQLKTNILSKDNNYVFHNIDNSNLKLLKFIIYQFINVYDEIKNNPETEKLCSVISKKSMENCIHELVVAIQKQD